MSRRKCRTSGRSKQQVAASGLWSEIQKPLPGRNAKRVLPDVSRIKSPSSITLGRKPTRSTRCCLHRLPRRAFGQAESAQPNHADRSLRQVLQGGAGPDSSLLPAPGAGGQNQLFQLPQCARFRRPQLLVKETVNQTCTTCHAEKRSPFLWEHQPVADDCTNCHTPHGSNMSPLLKVRVPMLCQTCHTSDHAKNLHSGANLPNGNVTTANGQIPLGSRSPAAQGNARSCLGCHSTIHGSNHPAGARFQR